MLEAMQTVASVEAASQEKIATAENRYLAAVQALREQYNARAKALLELFEKIEGLPEGDVTAHFRQVLRELFESPPDVPGSPK